MGGGLRPSSKAEAAAGCMGTDAGEECKQQCWKFLETLSMCTVPPEVSAAGRTERRLRETGEGPGCLNNFAEFRKGPRGEEMTKANKTGV